jgi:hypothetical protein
MNIDDWIKHTQLSNNVSHFIREGWGLYKYCLKCPSDQSLLPMDDEESRIRKPTSGMHSLLIEDVASWLAVEIHWGRIF